MLPSTDANILVDGLSSSQSLSDTQSCKQWPGYLLDAHKQHENLAEEAAITSDKPIDTVTLCNIGYIQQNKSTVNEDRTTSINNNLQTYTKDSKRKDCDTVSLTDRQAPPAKSMRLADREYRHRLPKGIMIALCCHHSCTWDTYLGQEFMHSCGVSPQEFDLLTRLSSWATCAKVTVKSAKNQRIHEKSDYKKSAELNEEKIVLDDQDEIEIVKVGSKTSHETNDLINLEASKTLREQLSVSEREEIGFKCKRLIDTGRLHYLRSKGMKCLLRRYISEELTPENVVLIAYLPSS
uniref:tRNA:m(4)X modification enzyme TRM13 n=1 Tax=Arion vulgaris TaxID=1028688 RepID=A0A0B6ZKU7_9EUPU